MFEIVKDWLNLKPMDVIEANEKSTIVLGNRLLVAAANTQYLLDYFKIKTFNALKKKILELDNLNGLIEADYKKLNYGRIQPVNEHGEKVGMPG